MSKILNQSAKAKMHGGKIITFSTFIWSLVIHAIGTELQCFIYRLCISPYVLEWSGETLQFLWDCLKLFAKFEVR